MQNAVRKHYRLPEEKCCATATNDEENILHVWEKLNYGHRSMQVCLTEISQIIRGPKAHLNENFQTSIF